jgi:hypothetical protein
MERAPSAGVAAVLTVALAFSVVAGALGPGVSPALAQGAPDASTIYRLNADSSFQQGCFAPCMCPILLGTDLRGTLVLTPTGSDGLFKTYAVTDVNWTAAHGDREERVTGSGTYKVGGESGAQQQLSLDLTIGDDPVQHFDSGLVIGGERFPDLRVTISMNGQVCYDTVFFVDASPVPPDQVHPYVLLAESTFQEGCYPPCRCPLFAPRPMSGTFALVDLRRDPLFTEFAVVAVDWLVAAAPDAPDTPVRGAGTYRVGGEFAVQQRLRLDVRVGDGDLTHFDSGLVAGGGEFPRIDVAASVNGFYCFDKVIDLHAVPAGPTTSAVSRDPAYRGLVGLRRSKHMPPRLPVSCSLPVEPRPRLRDRVSGGSDIVKNGAGEGSRTPTPLRAPDFESGLSSSSNTPAHG